jgi:hypothetical protein
MSGFSFQETMRGTWHPTSQPQLQRPIQFECVAAAINTRNYLQDGYMSLQGKIRVEGLAGYASCRGSLEVLLPLKRQLRYDIAFRGDDGSTYRFLGEKHVRYAHALYTMTHLSGQLLDATGQPIGSASLTFELRDLPSMVKSYLQSIRAGRPLLESRG